MKFFKLLVIIYLLTLNIVNGAVNDILSVTIRPDGWTADIVIQGKNVGGNYDFGLGLNNNPLTGAPKITFTVVSLGFNDSCIATTNTRTVYGTTEVRKPFNQQTSNEESYDGSNVTVRIALSDYIYAKDTSDFGGSGIDPVVNISAGFYSQGGTDNNATVSNFPVDNTSTAVYQKPIANKAWPGFQRVTPTTKFRVVAFHRHGQLGRPVRAVKFVVSDGVSTNSQIVTNPTYDVSMGDIVPVIEYVSSNNLVAGLTQGAELTINYEIYPWVGDAASVSYSSTVTDEMSPLFSVEKGVCDINGTYGVTYAVVDATLGSDPADVTITGDTGKWVGNDSDPGTGSGVTPFASFARAARAIRNYNNANRTTPTHDDVGGGIIYVKAGSYSIFGNTISGNYGAVPKTWLTITPFTGVTRDEVVITGLFGQTDISDRVKFDNITLTSNSDNTFAGCLALWFNDCILTTTSLTFFNTIGQRVWITGGEARTFAQGFRSYSTRDMTFPLIRSIDFTTFSGTVSSYTVIGNRRAVTGTGGPRFVDAVLGQLSPVAAPIIAFNELFGYDQTSTQVIRFGTISIPNTVGAAIVQNVIETYTGFNGGSASIFASDGASITGNTPCDNVIFWHNSCVGGRTQFAYNSAGSILKYRRYWSVKSNYWDISGYKTDTFTGSGGGDGARVGNWPVGFGVGATDNVNGNVAAINAVDFDFDFFGLNSIDTGVDNGITYAQFVDRRSYTGSSGTGQGDYHVTEGSPLEGGDKLSWLLPYDLAGDPRDTSNNATGAYVFGALSSGGNDPVLSITSPLPGASTVSPINLIGVATDVEDGDLSGSITWSSSIDGTLGTGGNISVPITTGVHIITASVVDSDTQIDSANVTITITSPSPTGTINATQVNAGTTLIQ